MTRVDLVAAALLDALETHRPIDPPTAAYPDLTFDEAYAAQLALIEALTAKGRRVVGHKVGLTSQAMQEMLGIDTPDFGHLMDDTAYHDGEVIDTNRFIQPRIEPEIAFVLGEPLRGPGITAHHAAGAVDRVVPSLEIVDSRVVDWRIGLLDTIADNASCGAYVLSTPGLPLGEVDLESVECQLEVDGRLVGSGVGRDVMGNPLNALTWLANTLGERGIGLEAGQVVLPGAVCAMVPVTAGATVTASFEGIGTVTGRFVAGFPGH